MTTPTISARAPIAPMRIAGADGETRTAVAITWDYAVHSEPIDGLDAYAQTWLYDADGELIAYQSLWLRSGDWPVWPDDYPQPPAQLAHAAMAIAALRSHP